MRLLTVHETAERIRLSRSKIYDLCSQGKLEHYKVDGSIRISEEQIQSYLDGCKVERATLMAPAKKSPQLGPVCSRCDTLEF